MFAVIFEVEPDPLHRQDDFAMAAALRAELDSIDGFLSIERFESLSRPGHLLLLSFWRDEAAVACWRKQVAHRTAQARGRAGVLLGCRLRVADVVRDHGMHERADAPPDARTAHGVARSGAEE